MSFVFLLEDRDVSVRATVGMRVRSGCVSAGSDIHRSASVSFHHRVTLWSPSAWHEEPTADALGACRVSGLR